MKQSVKHSKIKNTGILFELLTRQVTADILNANEKSSKAVKLVKKYFNERTEKATVPLLKIIENILYTQKGMKHQFSDQVDNFIKNAFK